MLDFFKGTVTPKDWVFVGVLVFLSLVLGVGYWFIIHAKQNEKIVALDGHISTIRTELRVVRDKQAHIDQLRDESHKMEELVDQFEKRLPEQREIPQLLQKFERQGDRLGLRVALASLPTTSDASKETIPYTVTCWGNFHQIVRFINLLERDERYLKISDLDIGEEEAGVSKATFTLSTFRFIQSISDEAADERG